MPTSEDELTNALIQYHKRSNEEMNESGPENYELSIFTEEHYNHYGDRGVVDLFVSEGEYDHLYELKSEHAVREATGANEIIRQFKRMRKFFYKGTDHTPAREVMFELCFAPSELTFRHLAKNADMYASVVQQGDSELTSDVSSQVHVRPADPENIHPVIMFSEQVDCRDGFTRRSFAEYVQQLHPEMFEEHAEVITAISD